MTGRAQPSDELRAKTRTVGEIGENKEEMTWGRSLVKEAQ